MSFWAKVGVKITDLDCFKRSCDRNDIRYERNTNSSFRWNNYEVHAFLHDNQGRGSAYLIKDGGAFRLAMDTDAHYSSITQRLGKNGGRLSRDYAVEAVRKGVQRGGAMITNQQEQPDGSVVLRAVAM